MLLTRPSTAQIAVWGLSSCRNRERISCTAVSTSMCVMGGQCAQLVCLATDPSKQNEYGFTLGGPLVLPKLYHGKDKTLFFILYEGFNYRTQAGGSNLTVSTAAMRAGNFSEWSATG